MNPATFTELEWRDDYWTAVLHVGNVSLSVEIEPDVVDPTEAELESLLADSQRLAATLAPQVIAKLRRDSATEITDASYQQCDCESTPDEIAELESDMTLRSITFLSEGAQFAWLSPSIFPGCFITMQTDSNWAPLDCMVQENPGAGG